MRSALHNNSHPYDGSYLEVVFADFASKTGARECVPATPPADGLSVPEGVFEAVVQGMQLLNREALTITQRNVNRSFSLLKRLVTMRNFGTLIDLEVAYWPDRFFALTGQIEALSRLSAKALLDTLDVVTVGPPVAQITAREPRAISQSMAGKDEAPRGDKPLGAKVIRTLAPL
jgi:hypothetical protein